MATGSNCFIPPFLSSCHKNATSYSCKLPSTLFKYGCDFDRL